MRRTAGRVGWGGGPGEPASLFFPRPEPQVLEERERDHGHQRVPVQAGPGAALEVVEAELLLHPLVRLLADPARLDRGRRLLERGLRASSTICRCRVVGWAGSPEPSPSKKWSGSTPSACASVYSRPALIRLAPVSYLCACWEVVPTCAASCCCVRPSAIRRAQSIVPTWRSASWERPRPAAGKLEPTGTTREQPGRASGVAIGSRPRCGVPMPGWSSLRRCGTTQGA